MGLALKVGLHLVTIANLVPCISSFLVYQDSHFILEGNEGTGL
jgi:hypothetical protein